MRQGIAWTEGIALVVVVSSCNDDDDRDDYYVYFIFNYGSALLLRKPFHHGQNSFDTSIRWLERTLERTLERALEVVSHAVCPTRHIPVT